MYHCQTLYNVLTIYFCPLQQSNTIWSRLWLGSKKTTFIRLLPKDFSLHFPGLPSVIQFLSSISWPLGPDTLGKSCTTLLFLGEGGSLYWALSEQYHRVIYSGTFHDFVMGVNMFFIYAYTCILNAAFVD